MKILFVVLMFFVISALMMISNNNLAMYDYENVGKFSELYIGWLDKIYMNFQLQHQVVLLACTLLT